MKLIFSKSNWVMDIKKNNFKLLHSTKGDTGYSMLASQKEPEGTDYVPIEVQASPMTTPGGV